MELNDERLCIFVFTFFWFLSTGMSLRVLTFSFRVSHTEIRRIIYETCTSIWKCFHKIHMPIPTEEKWKAIATDFCEKWNFPNCVGCLDGKHIRIKYTQHTGSLFYNYKGYFSILLQAVADANY